MLTGLERFVRLVVERQVPIDSPQYTSPGVDVSPRIFGLPRPYTGLYSANSYMANRPGSASYRLSNNLVKSGVDKMNGVNANGAPHLPAWNGPVRPPKPAPRRFTKSDSVESQEKTEATQVCALFLFPLPMSSINGEDEAFGIVLYFHACLEDGNVF